MAEDVTNADDPIVQILLAERFEVAPMGWTLRRTMGDAPEWVYITECYEVEVRPHWSKLEPVRWVWALYSHTDEKIVNGTRPYALDAMRAGIAEMERVIGGE
ncbi:MAG: hypothetical protein AAFV53_13100 [Myxococcota bacterium]